MGAFELHVGVFNGEYMMSVALLSTLLTELLDYRCKQHNRLDLVSFPNHKEPPNSDPQAFTASSAHVSALFMLS